MAEPFRLDMHVNGISERGRRNELRRRRDSRSFCPNCNELVEVGTRNDALYRSIEAFTNRNPEMGKERGPELCRVRERERKRGKGASRVEEGEGWKCKIDG